VKKNFVESFAVSQQRRIDADQMRDHFESVLGSYEQVFEKFFLAKLIGLEFEYLPLEAADADKEVSRLTFTVNEMLMNPQGTLHGGIMATVMDISMGHLLRKTIGPGITVEMNTQFLRAAPPGLARAEARFVKKGRSLSFMESRLWGADDKLAALTTATWKML